MSDTEPTAAPADDREKPANKPTRALVPAPSTDPLGWLYALAALGVAALLLGRFLGPALPGVTVGMARAVRAVEVLGDSLSLLFAVSAIVGLLVALLSAIATSIPPWIRLLLIGTSLYTGLGVVFTVIACMFSADRGPGSHALPAAFAAGSVAVIASLASRAARIARLPALAVGVVGASALARAFAALVELHLASWLTPATVIAITRGASTVAVILIALANVLALVHIGRSAPASPSDDAPPDAPARAPLWSPATIAVVVLALLCAREASRGGAPDASVVSVVLKRMADRFLRSSDPYLRPPIRLFLGFLTPFTAAAALVARRVRTLTAALCLALIAADVTDAPLGALTLVLASLGVLLVARSGHVLWSALVARPPAAPPRGA